MTTPEQSLADQLDASFGTGPAPRDLDPLLAAGRTAVRRRRIAGATVGSGLAVLAVVGGAFALGGGTSPASDAPGYAAEPTATNTHTSSSSCPPPGSVARDIPLLKEGRFVPPQGSTIGDTVRGVSNRGTTGDAYEIVCDNGGHAFTVVDPDTGQMHLVVDQPAERSLADWLEARGWERQAGTTDSQPAQAEPPLTATGSPLVRVVDGAFVAKDGAVILAQRSDPGFPDNFAPAGSTQIAAKVRVDGVDYFVLYRDADGPEFFHLPLAGSDYPADLDAFVDHARAAYESGEGLL